MNTTNKKERSMFFAVFIIGVIISLTLGIPFMSHSNPAGHSDCLVAILNNSKCNSTNMLQAFTLHANSILRIFTGILTQVGFSLSVLLSLVFFIGPLLFFYEQHTLRKLQLSELDKSESFAKVLRWISIHEKRDPWPIF